MTDEDYDKIIDELEAELAEYKHVASAIDKQWAESQDEIADLKAKLAKAVEALEKVQTFVRELEPYADQGHVLVPALHDACTTIAELKGEKDE